MNTGRFTFFNVVLIAIASLVVGMVIAARLDLAPSSLAGSFAPPAVNSSPLDGPVDATTFRTIASEASPAVVSISILGQRPVAQTFSDLFGANGRNRGGGGAGQEEELLSGAGSGFIIDAGGLILTNNHVIEDATSITVTLSDMRSDEDGLPARVVGRDELTDTALIQLTTLPAHPLTVARFGDSSQLAPGDWVMAIGNPYRLSNSVSVGIVSAVGRAYAASISATGGSRFEEMIQTDAAINKGNSGGPLLNVRGEVVGINTMIYSDNTGGNIGIGFAVPISRILPLLPQLRQGRVVRGRIGVSLAPHHITPADADDWGLPSAAGAIISTVDNGPAKAAGMKVADIVIEYNGKPVSDNDALIAMVTSTPPGTTVPVKIVRNRKALTLNVTIEELDLAQEQGLQAAAAQRAQEPPAPKDTGFGMTIQEITPATARQLGVQGKGGAVVSQVDPLGQAARQGVQVGDVILQVNGQEMTNIDQVSRALDAVAAGRTARLVVSRRGQDLLILVPKH